MARASFDRALGTITIYDDNGVRIESYNAGNRTINPTGDPYAVGSNAPAPCGTFPVQPPITVSREEQARFGPYFWPIGAVGPNGERIDIARQRGIGFHGGRSGPQSRTLGCIRASNADIIDVYNRTQADRITEITIVGR